MRFFLSLLLARLTYFALKLLKKQGSVLPGHYVLLFNPRFLSQARSRLLDKVVLVSGTNGKTTIAGFLAEMLQEAGMAVIRNRFSANLPNGIATSLALSTKHLPTYPQSGDKFWGIFEVDEGFLPSVLADLRPDLVILSNLSRDQLDRYGELDLLVQRWHSAFARLQRVGSFPQLVCGERSSHFLRLVSGFPCDKVCFLSSPSSQMKKIFSSQPPFFALNAQLALRAGMFLGIDRPSLTRSLSRLRPVFGRGERISFQGVSFSLFLAKNPRSFEENLSFWAKRASAETAFLLALNDNIPDGRDVSWIYDINPVLLRRALSSRLVVVSGLRAIDFALRLKYAEVRADILIEPRLARAVTLLVERGAPVVVLPTYSAMLRLRKIIVGREFE